MKSKTCYDCGENLPDTDAYFPRNPHQGGVFRRNICKACANLKIACWRRGITIQQYHQMLDEQNHVCAICNKHGVHPRFYWLCIDHCHETGKVRGLLCQKCNQAIGMLGDNPETIRRAADYVERHKENGGTTRDTSRDDYFPSTWSMASMVGNQKQTS